MKLSYVQSFRRRKEKDPDLFGLGSSQKAGLGRIVSTGLLSLFTALLDRKWLCKDTKLEIV